MNKSQDILKKIHNTDPWIKIFSDKTIAHIAYFVVVLMYISPYWIRIFWAFSLNLIFNSPKVYWAAFGKFVGKRMNAVMVTLLYIFFLGTYSLLTRAFGKKNKKEHETLLIDEEYLYRQF